MEPDRERELRRGRSTLRSLAGGIVAFGLWSAIKGTIMVLLKPLESRLSEEDQAFVAQPGMRTVFYIMVVLIILAVVALILMPRIYIGIKARREGLGKDQGRAWVILAILLFVVWIAVDAYSLLTFSTTINEGVGKLDSIISLILDLSNTVLLGELCFTAVRVKKLMRGEG